MKNMISMLTDMDRDEAQCVFIFPEGTDLSKSNITKSNACKLFNLTLLKSFCVYLYACMFRSPCLYPCFPMLQLRRSTVFRSCAMFCIPSRPASLSAWTSCCSLAEATKPRWLCMISPSHTETFAPDPAR